MNARDELRRVYEEAARDAYEESKAIMDEAVEKAEARRRFHVDPDGCAVIAYADPADEPEAA
jgi:hypothetical protein